MILFFNILLQSLETNIYPTQQNAPTRGAFPLAELLQQLFGGHQCHCGIQHAVRETPLVVVPRRYLDQTTGHFGQRRIEGARCRVVVEINRYQWCGVVLQDAF